MTRLEVAELFNVSPRTVDSWVAQGHLQRMKVGPAGSKGTVRYRREDVLALIESQEAS